MSIPAVTYAFFNWVSGDPVFPYNYNGTIDILDIGLEFELLQGHFCPDMEIFDSNSGPRTRSRYQNDALDRSATVTNSLLYFFFNYLFCDKVFLTDYTRIAFQIAILLG